MKIVGFTTGVFDLFHIGHLNILENAKKKCDYLIVGVTTDELCEELKNNKPYIPFKERIEIVKSIEYVDEVVEQKVINEIQDWQELKFHKIFKGSDWKNTIKWNHLEIEFKKLGVEVVFFPYTKGTSSTKLKEAIS